MFTGGVTYQTAGTPPMALFVAECVYHRTECNLHLYKLAFSLGVILRALQKHYEFGGNVAANLKWEARQQILFILFIFVFFQYSFFCV